MSFATLSNAYASEIKIPLDNLFILEYLPNAPDEYVKVYIYGLSNAITDKKDNTLPRIATLLNLEEKKVLEAYAYWDSLGLVRLYEGEEPSVIYLSIQNAKGITKKYNKAKYATFNEELQKYLKESMLKSQDYYRFYEIMEEYKMDWDAMLCVANYCIKLKGKNNSSMINYILAVARNLANDGNLTFDAVLNNLNELKLYETDIKKIFEALRIYRKVDHDDKQFYLKWKKLGFDLDTIIFIAKQKRSSIENLDKLICDYYDKKLLSISEIKDYNSKKDGIKSLARTIVKNLGLYYEQVDNVIETYLLPWYKLGFDDNSLIYISNYCFQNSIRKLEQMDKIVRQFYGKSLLSQEAIETNINLENVDDNKIQNILQALNINRPISQSDRIIYKTWTKNWQTPKELIDYAITLSIEKEAPLPFMNKLLSTWAHEKIKDIKDAKAKHVQFLEKRDKNKIKNQKKKEDDETLKKLNEIFENMDF